MSTSTPLPATAGANPLQLEVLVGILHHHKAAYRSDISAGVGVAVVASRIVVNSTACELHGWCLRETTGAAKADIRLHDGKDATTELLAAIDIPSGGSSIALPQGQGVQVRTGTIFLEWIAGSVEGVIYWKPIADNYE